MSCVILPFMLNITQRQMIVRLSKQKKKQQEIADIIGCSQPTVNFWLRRESKGISLQTLPRSGRPTPLTKKTLARLRKELSSEAREANKKFCSINIKQFSKKINDRANKNYSPRHIRRLLHEMNFSRITPRSQHIKNDPAKVAAFRDEFKKNSKQSIWVMNL